MTVGDLPGLDDQSRLVMVRRLLREGVLTPADPTDHADHADHAGRGGAGLA